MYEKNGNVYDDYGRPVQQCTARRGDVYYVNNNRGQCGNEIRKDRPAVIVSADFLNKYSGDVTVVFMTSQPKKDMETHVMIDATGRESAVLCEQPTTISVERLRNRIGSVTEEEMRRIDLALRVALDLTGGGISVREHETTSGRELHDSMIRLEAERDTYKKLYEELLNGRK